MFPVNQVILGGGDPLLSTTSIGSNIEEQIQLLEKQKQLLENAKQQRMQQMTQPQVQQPPQKLIWDEIDSEIEPMTDEQKNMLFQDEDYVDTYNKLQSLVQAEILSLVKGRIEGTQEGKDLLTHQLKIVKKLKGKIIDTTAKYTVSQMYHTENGRKYVGEKFDMSKAKEVCERYRGIIPQSVTHADVYVAINAQYHDYCELFKAWFGDNIDTKIIESAINFWFKDDDYKGGCKIWKYFKEA